MARSDTASFILSADENLDERVAARLEPQGDCLVWTGATNAAGRGVVSVTVNGDERTIDVPRVRWLRAGVSIPEGHALVNRCGISACAKLRHYQVVPQGDLARAAAQSRWEDRDDD